jgi:flagellar protein FlaF
MYYTATSNGFEQVTDAQQDQADRELDRQNTEMFIDSATWDGSTLTVTANNTGATSLSLSEVDLLADNNYLTGYATSVEGDTETGLWAPGESLTITVDSLDAELRVVDPPEKGPWNW